MFMRAPRLMAVLAHPDDESLGVGGTLAKYAAKGIGVFLLTATRGESGRYRGHPPGDRQHPGPAALAGIREAELRAAASMLGVHEVSLLDHHDQHLDCVNPRQVIAEIVRHLRRVRPDVIVTFGPDGAYGHPDHIAVSQFTTAAVVAAANPAFVCEGVGRCSFRVEALLPRLAGIDLGRLSGGDWAVGCQGRRRRTSRHGMARLGDHHGDRHTTLLADGLASSLVPRITSGGVRAVEELAASAPRGTVGIAVVLPGAQYREWRTRARNRSL
jgi:LmbE family N-acetylglucosaminyl deacetylase